MWAYEVARNASVGILTYFGFFTPTTITNVATTVQNTVVHETPYVWARDFLEQSGFDLTERVPAILGVYQIPGATYRHEFPSRSLVPVIPPQLVHELSLNWTFTLIGNVFQLLVQIITECDMVDLAWLLVFVLMATLLYLWPYYPVLILSRGWAEMKDDVANFVQRGFHPEIFTSVSATELGMLQTSAKDLEILKTSTNTLEKQLAEARMALEEEKAGHQETKDFLIHQNNARANAEEELEKLRSSLETGEPEEENSQLETIEEAEEESPAGDETGPQPDPKREGPQQDEEESPVEAIDSRPDVEEEDSSSSAQIEPIGGSDAKLLPGQIDSQADPAADDQNTAYKAQFERIQRQLNIEQQNYRFVVKKKEVFRHGGLKLKKEFDDLQAQYNVLEDSRDTWRESFEALEQQADVQAFRTLRDQSASDNAHYERRIEALQTQLGFETNNREEAQNIARQARERLESVKDELREANTKYEDLQISYEELVNTYEAEERSNETNDDLQFLYEELRNAHKAEESPNKNEDPYVAGLEAEYKRLEAEIRDLDERYNTPNAERTGAAETTAVENEDRSQQNEMAILQQPKETKTTNEEAGAPLRHHADTFDPLYNVSDYGDDDGDDKDGGEDLDGADKAATDPDLAHKDHVANLPGLAEYKPPSELPLNNGQRLANLPIPEPSPQRASSSLNGSASEFVPSVRPKRPIPPILPHHQAYIASQQSFTSSGEGVSGPHDVLGKNSPLLRSARVT